MDATSDLQRLVEAGFEGAWIPDDEGYPAVLVYMRRWSSGTVDVVTVLDADKASGLRATDVDLGQPDSLDDDVVQWRTSGTVSDVAAEVLELPDPDGVPISARAADLRISTDRAGELWTP